MKNWGKIGISLMLLCGTGLTQAKEVKVPMIVSDHCSSQPDENGARQCKVKYSDGSTDTYWVKQGKIYWHYPIPGMPSGGIYRPKK
ncbi:hypothetical protein CSB45_16225 [candidate division KSB3 bacterium]|uniref:Uncharacterized protein n=1 Tax=candidate division KSB3 bacterium TaxID=2044937 RepID=A0A2G6E084_9BACT|nr:MAG: hypothetical protein CSB45_16225 [candidate division KSB3 bacterium]